MSYFRESADLKVKEDIIRLHGKTLEEFNGYVEILKTWITTQPHLPQVLTHRQVECFLVMTKINVDKARSKIDMYFSIRSRFPDVFLNSHPFCDRMKQAQEFICFVPAPKLCGDLNRLFLIKIKPVEDPMQMDPYACFALLLNVVDVRLLEDMCNGHTVIFDMAHLKIGHLLRVTPTFIRTMFLIGERSLTTRVAALHIINAPSFIDQTVLLVKSIVKAKLGERIIVHKGVESATKFLDKDTLPKDYGGNEKTLEELEDVFMGKLEYYKGFFDERERWEVNENFMPEKYKDEGVFGAFGNFQKLEVD
ncbi:hypothetical protein NQ315_000296 [Exocentrus adspersus]|uniref:CRAL-TRIO domain-containing protein n=1 Tax=Exocentrus adspersus TaxID=1586481 RepID=A0AAV8VQC7_9CUCU|nr:hypothetical protein NQ315_000296 [Exocentrus adspersus]